MTKLPKLNLRNTNYERKKKTPQNVRGTSKIDTSSIALDLDTGFVEKERRLQEHNQREIKHAAIMSTPSTPIAASAVLQNNDATTLPDSIRNNPLAQSDSSNRLDNRTKSNRNSDQIHVTLDKPLTPSPQIENVRQLHF